jgi:hypothetical protein
MVERGNNVIPLCMVNFFPVILIVNHVIFGLIGPRPGLNHLNTDDVENRWVRPVLVTTVLLGNLL